MHTPNKNHKNIHSFKAAYNGLKIAFITQKHIKIHFILAILTLITSFLLKISILEYSIILLCIAMVISLELINTAIEYLSDLHSKEFNLKIKAIKDVSASSVLCSCITSFIIGCIILIPKCLNLIENWN